MNQTAASFEDHELKVVSVVWWLDADWHSNLRRGHGPPSRPVRLTELSLYSMDEQLSILGGIIKLRSFSIASNFRKVQSSSVVIFLVGLQPLNRLHRPFLLPFARRNL